MFSNLKIGARLGAGFAVVLLALAGIWALSMANVQHAFGLAQRAADLHAKTDALSRAQSAVWSLRWDVAQFIAVTNPADRKQIVERSAPTRKQFGEAMAVYEHAKAGALSPEEDALSKELSVAFGKYSDARLRWFELLGAGKDEEAVRFRADALTPAGAATNGALAKLIAVQGKLVEQGESGFISELERSRIAVSALGLAALVLASTIAWLLSRSISRPLRQAVQAVEAVASGDLTQPIAVTSRDEHGQLLAALARMQQNLREVVGEVIGSAHAVAESSGQIAQGNVDLSQRTEEQASTLEETASSMEELTATVNQNADHARRADQLAAGASEVAARGGQVVGEVVRTMTGISEASRKIADIIGVIDGIAFQTNILALNAAVEAARAGDQGRGFAVVAAEVRSLAQRSASAAKEIKQLIGDSVGQVDAGTRLVDAAGKTMEEIVGSVCGVSKLIAEIASASQEQSEGIAQVTSAVTQMEQVVQQNAALVEEATASTESMKTQAAGLLRTVQRFRIGEHEVARPAAAPVKPASIAAPPLAMPALRVVARAPTEAQAEAERPRLAASGSGAGAWQEF